MPNIKLASSDGLVFEVEEDVARQSTTLRTMLDLGFKEDDEEVIPLPNLNSKILSKIIEWATHHKDDLPRPPSPDLDLECLDPSMRRTDDIPEWDVEFLKVDVVTLFEMIQAANYLDIKGLLEVSCKTVANMIKGKTPAEIRANFELDKRQRPRVEPSLVKAEPSLVKAEPLLVKEESSLDMEELSLDKDEPSDGDQNL